MSFLSEGLDKLDKLKKMAFRSFNQTELNPTLNPSVPVIRPVPQPLLVGQRIYIKGTIRSHANGFHINLSLGAGLGEDASIPIALHINPRFTVEDGDGEPYVVRNSFLEGKWGIEEKKGPSPIPLSLGQRFDCIILVHSDCYKIAFNGQHFCEYKHRTYKNDVSHLVVEGDISLDSITFDGDLPTMRPLMEGETLPTEPHYKLAVPFKTQIPGGLFAGKVIYISGLTPAPQYDKFEINLMYTKETNIDVAFHFNPRYELAKVVRNTLKGVTWGKEDRTDPKPSKYAKGEKYSFPFVAGRHFDIAIMVEEDKYKVAVNGEHFCDYEHRLTTLSKIQFIEISGDVRLSNVTI